MSDTCYLQIECRRSDIPKFAEVLKNHMYEGKFWDEDAGNKVASLIIYEANYGWSTEVDALADAGLSFLVEHGAGSDYGPCVIACWKADQVECSADIEGNPVVIVLDESGAVEPGEIENARKYHRYRRLIQDYFKS